MNNNPKFAGFTLIEEIIVLLIVCFFILVPTIMLKNWQENLEVRQFFNEWERNVLLTQQRAIVTQYPTEIQLVSQQNEIYFFQNDSGEMVDIILEIPKSVEVKSFAHRIKFNGSTGHYSKLGKVEFRIVSTAETITYQFQMGSGRYKKYTE